MSTLAGGARRAAQTSGRLVRRSGHLFERVANFDAPLAAELGARRRERSRPDGAFFVFHSGMNLLEMEIELCAIACAMRLYESVARMSRAVSRIRSGNRYGPNMRCSALWRPDFRHLESFPLPTRWMARAGEPLQQAPTECFSCGSRSCVGSARPTIWIESCITQSLTFRIRSLLLPGRDTFACRRGKMVRARCAGIGAKASACTRRAWESIQSATARSSVRSVSSKRMWQQRLRTALGELARLGRTVAE